MAKSEGSQHIYNSLKNAIPTPFGNRIMEEVGVIRGLEVDETRNYILIPMTHKENGKEVNTAWEIHMLSKDCKIAMQVHEDENLWWDEDFREVRGEPTNSKSQKKQEFPKIFDNGSGFKAKVDVNGQLTIIDEQMYKGHEIYIGSNGERKKILKRAIEESERIILGETNET